MLSVIAYYAKIIFANCIYSWRDFLLVLAGNNPIHANSNGKTKYS